MCMLKCQGVPFKIAVICHTRILGGCVTCQAHLKRSSVYIMWLVGVWGEKGCALTGICNLFLVKKGSGMLVLTANHKIARF